MEKTIQQWNMLEDHDTVVLGLSGGMDSVCLFHLFRELAVLHGYRIIAVHLNHELREEAGEDEKFVKELCNFYGVELVCCSRDISQLAKEFGHGIEEQAREERYQLFEEVRIEYGAKAIALAHHREDQAETVLHHMIRGSALRGLGGMRYKRDHIIRPLLSCSKKMLETYLLEKQFKWVEDSSNRSLVYTRNRLRHQVLPLLREINPSVDKLFFETSLLLQKDEEALEALSVEWMKQYVTVYGVLGARVGYEHWEAAPFAFRARFLRKIYYVLTGCGLEKKYILQLEEQWSHCSEIDLPGGVFVRINKNCITVGSKHIKKIPYEVEMSLPGEVELEVGLIAKSSLVMREEYEKLTDEKCGNALQFHADLDKLGERLLLRNRQPKDAYKMLGAKGQSSVKKIFSAMGLGGYANQNLPVICSGTGEIVWVVGGRINSDFKVTKKTSRIVIVELLLH
ncbi:tRNA lysidine(34) synthetase TilS [Clostridia bacterium]|nr:tRNA lysidine(34) synthetase TilS [Clostridia bacterium]